MRIKRRRDAVLLAQDELFLKILKLIEEKGWTIEQAFNQFDTDKDGNIDFVELFQQMQKHQIRVTKNEVMAIFAILDLNDNGYISLEEFIAKLKKIQDEIRQRELDKKAEEDRKRKEQEERDREAKLLDDEERKRREEEERKRRELEERLRREYEAIKKEIHNQLLALVDKRVMFYRDEQREFNSKKKKKKDKAFLEDTRVNGILKVHVGKGIDLHDFRKLGFNKYFILLVNYQKKLLIIRLIEIKISNLIFPYNRFFSLIIPIYKYIIHILVNS